ncbi:transmembrane ascorbate-dependent reductase CYB561 [Phlebotomus argentipes]|uniref:transmembrane ascorbate-dependent reductase CYB561 n=1 Tax=Phlebotomus argentipes TaxID=94469 RepID=UPI002892D22B|nr:transmembrane ascorbate-dependent reductase CYB561 [Phlebotomus argentipes]
MEEIGASNLGHFNSLYLGTLLVGLLLVILVGGWIGSHLGGLAWHSNPAVQFNWHPLLMTIGMIFLYGNAILIYRGFRMTKKRNLKITHATLHGLAFLATVLGLKAVFDSHDLASPPIPNLYSMHSWLGLLAVILFSAQYLVGFISFLAPGLSQPLREKIMPYHVLFGLYGFVAAAATALLGFSEKIFFTLKSDYANLPAQGILVNFIALFVILFAGLVVYLATESRYKRQALPEDAILLTGQTD